MIIYKITFNNVEVEFNTRLNAENFAIQNNIALEDITEESRQATVDLNSIVLAAIQKKQEIGLPLLTEIFVENTLAGITTEQSKQIFQDYLPMLVCILCGAFPTAYSLLNDAQPSGFVTQERLDAWKAKLAQHL